MATTQELLEKTLETADFGSGGHLNPEQQDEFVRLTRVFSTLLERVRFVRMKQPRMDIDKMHIGEPVTVSTDENTDPGVLSKPKFNKVELSAKKVKSAWNITTEVLQANIEGDAFEQTLFSQMVRRISHDLEALAVSGDTTIVGADPTAALLVRLDGWVKQSDSAHIVDADGLNIDKEIFSQMLRDMPKQFRNDPDLRWIMSDTLVQDWLSLLSERADSVGVGALQGENVKPFGIPILSVPLFPDDLAVKSSDAAGAVVTGIRQGPFVIAAGANKVRLAIDGGGDVDITLTSGTLLASEVAAQISAALTTAGKPAFAADDARGKLQLVGQTPDVGGSVEVKAIAGDAYAVLGLTAALTTGVAAGGDVPEGTVIMLTNPNNLIWGMLDGTRIFTEFNKDFDRIETAVYNQVDAKIENLDALVKSVNIRLRNLSL